jgi:hypothetical protein
MEFCGERDKASLPVNYAEVTIITIVCELDWERRRFAGNEAPSATRVL